MFWSRNKVPLITIAVILLGAGTIAGGYGLEYRQEQRQMIERAQAITGGSVTRGQTAFANFGCGSCHAIKGVPQASGKVGPPLDGVGDRVILAGRLKNTPQNMQTWIRDPRSVDPQTAMPYLGLNEQQARDISAFLYTLS